MLTNYSVYISLMFNNIKGLGYINISNNIK